MIEPVIQDAFWIQLIVAVVSTIVSVVQAKKSAAVQEKAAAEAAQFRHESMILAEEQQAVEAENAARLADLNNQQLARQTALVEGDISASEIQALKDEDARREAAKRLAASNLGAFGGDLSSPSFRAFMAQNENVYEDDVSTIRLRGQLERFGLEMESENIGIQARENILGAEFIIAGSEHSLAANRITARSNASRDNAQVRLSSIKGNAMVARSIISGAGSVAKAFPTAGDETSGGGGSPGSNTRPVL